MFDPQQEEQVRQEVIRREGDVRSRISQDAEIDPDAGTDALWQQWLDLTAKLQGIGFSHKTLCDASGTITTVRAEAEQEAGTRATA